MLMLQGKIAKLDSDGYYGYINYSEGDLPFHGNEIINEGWVRIVVMVIVIIIINKLTKVPMEGEEVMFSVSNDEVAIRVSHIAPSSLHNDWLDGIVRLAVLP